MNIALVIPDRGDRRKFKENCMRMIGSQTIEPTFIADVNYEARTPARDITQRYRIGYARCMEAKENGTPIDVIALWENDDWYAPDYLETMYREWNRQGQPDIFGTSYTIYYHIKLRKFYTMRHDERASAMNTFLKPRLKIDWPLDQDPFTDLALWMKQDFKGTTWKPSRHISLGIKHGIGLTGGKSHVDRFDRYEGPRGTDDSDLSFLKATMDPESFEFYSTYFERVTIL